MKKIYYLGYYDIPENKSENRNIVLSATNKMTYIIEALEKCDCSVEVVSTAHTSNLRSYPEKIIQIGAYSSLRLFKSTRWGNKIRRIISVLYTRYQYEKYILDNLTPEDTLIVYHSVDYADFIVKAKKKIDFRLILEVEEIYADVNGKENERIKENKVFESADAYIFPTKLLDDKLNVDKKPSIIIHGTYKVEPQVVDKFNDGRVHIVYAGTFDPRKGGTVAAETARFLDENYHIHILGFGNKSDRDNLLNEINRTSKLSSCKITFDGLLSGSDYTKFIQRCHIGLSPQNPNASFNATSFPSKVLSYMANGLRVVCIRIPAIEKSAVGKYMFFYDEQTPIAVAQTIKNIDFTEHYDSRVKIENLNINFIGNLKNFLNFNGEESKNE